LAQGLTALGGMALLMSVVSIYALLSFMVTRRTREIGLRLALGARSSQVLVTVVGHTAVLLGGGAVVGTIVGVMLAGFQSVMLIRMPAVGWATPAIVVIAVFVASAVAAWRPTRRALTIRPAQALSVE
jgi:ABC-type antimicrobial peptide transport system permease subunit